MVWTSVEDCLPKKETEVIAVHCRKEPKVPRAWTPWWFPNTFYTCFFTGNFFVMHSTGEAMIPTHWMYAPEMPEEDNK